MKLLVERPDRIRRLELFQELKGLRSKLARFGIPCTVYLDGSYVTEKELPDDIDVIVLIEEASERYLSEEAKLFLDAINDDVDRPFARLDTFVVVTAALGEENREVLEPDRATWFEHFMVEPTTHYLKGMAAMWVVPQDV